MHNKKILVTGLEPAHFLVITFKAIVSTNSTKQAFNTILYFLQKFLIKHFEKNIMFAKHSALISRKKNQEKYQKITKK